MKKLLLSFLVIAVVLIVAVVLFSSLFFVGFSGSAAPSFEMQRSLPSLGVTTAQNIGLSVGGAKDTNNFRRNIENNYLPLPTDITYEGLFYEYFFDTGETEECTQLFCPSYTYAISKDPFSLDKQYYISVGLNSGIKENDFQRKKLNLVIVLDNSGSMDSLFDRYYYDSFGNRVEINETDDPRYKKIKVATESIVALLGHLKEGDRFGMVTFNDVASLIQLLKPVTGSEMESLKSRILGIAPSGSTQLSAGMKMGTDLFKDFLNVNQSEYENRIIFLTDAMPNRGETGEGTLLYMLKKNAETKLYTTFIGIGIDFNTELVDYITKVRGANYYSVHSSKQFKERMDEEFEYMVTPLVFNLLLRLDAEGYKIEKVYGSPEANESTGELMKVNTLFPSKKEENQTKGGLVLLKLKKIATSANLKLKVTYEDREGKTSENTDEIMIEEKEQDFFENTGIRKGILLSRYADLVKNWIIDERISYGENKAIQPSVNEIEGIVIPSSASLGEWERQSIPLRVSEQYKNLFRQFRPYFEREMSSLSDSTLSQELVVMDKLINYNG